MSWQDLQTLQTLQTLVFSLDVHFLVMRKIGTQFSMEKPDESALHFTICASISTDFPLATGLPVA